MAGPSIPLEDRYVPWGGKAVLGGVVAGLAAGVTRDSVAVAIGLGVTTPLLAIHAIDMDAEAYAPRTTGSTIVDVVVTAAVGAGVALLAVRIGDVPAWLLVAIGAAGAVGGGTFVFTLRTRSVPT